MVVLIEHDISGLAFLLLTKEYGYKFWVHIVTMIDEHGTIVKQYTYQMHIICSIIGYQYDEIMSCDNIKNHISHQENKGIVWRLKYINAHEKT